MLALKKMRLRAGMRQSDIAKCIGVKSNTISQWENGVRQVPVNQLHALAAALNCTIADLFAEESA